MTRTILGRLRILIPALLITTILSFSLRVIIPGGPADALLGGSDNPDTIAMINERYGLADPMWLQYLNWLKGVVVGDFGISYATGLPVMDSVGPRLLPTIELVLLGAIFALVVGGALGMFGAVRRHTVAGRVVAAASGFGVSIPIFWLSTICAGVFGAWLGLLPVNGFTPLSDGLVPHLRSIIMPVILLAIPATALMTRHVRSSMIAALESPYIRTAWAMGISAKRVYFDLALRNAIGPIITFIPFLVAILVGELVIIDVVFVLPGLGSAIIDAVHFRDYASLQAIVVILASTVLILSMLADLALAAIDPRRRKEAA